MKKVLSFVLVGILLLGLSVYAFAHGGGNRFAENYRNGYRNNKDHDQLELSGKQEDKIEGLQDKYDDEMEDVAEDLRDKSRELRELYFDKAAKDNDILELQAMVNQLRDKMSTIMIKMRLEMRDILTAEQLEIMEDSGMMGFGMMKGYGIIEERGFRGHMSGHMMHGNGMMRW